MKRRHIKYILIIVLILLTVSLFRSCYRTFVNTDQEVFTSPEGTNTIIVTYDFVCHPTIYKKGLIWNKKIWETERGGFMETVRFDVEWLSENQIRFTCKAYDEEYLITIPD